VVVSIHHFLDELCKEQAAIFSRADLERYHLTQANGKFGSCAGAHLVAVSKGG
jgi:hypothetical protein